MAQQTFSGVPGTFSAGEILTASDQEKLRDFLLYLIKDGDETDTGEVSPVIMDLGNDRVGINTDAPAFPLDVVGASHNYIGILAGTDSSAGLRLRNDARDWDLNITTADKFAVYDQTASATRLTIDTAGRVGINRGAPIAKLHVVASDGWDSADYALRVDNLETTAAQGNGIQVQAGSGAGASYPMFLWDNSSGACMYVRDDARVHVYGVFSKASESFDIPHPTKSGDWRLRHSFIEGPQADNLYRGTVTLTGGTGTVDLDAVSNMTAGTWEALNRDPWSMVASSGNIVEWSLSGKTLTITSDTADAVCTWIVIGERQDDHMKSAQGSLADDDGHLIVEYEEAQPVPPPPPDTEDTADAGPPLDG